MDEEAILGGLRSGEDLPDFDYEDFEVGSTGQDRRGEDPGRDTPRSRGRYTDDGDDRIFRQATDDEQAQRVRSDRSGPESGRRRGQVRLHQHGDEHGPPSFGRPGGHADPTPEISCSR